MRPKTTQKKRFCGLGPARRAGGLVMTDTAEAPIAYRVWRERWGVKLTSSKPPPKEFQDFTTKEEAIAFKQSQRETYPHSVFCIEPIYLTGTTQNRSTRPRPRR
jgi:hypothetical protein